jgi:hypothetical protein
MVYSRRGVSLRGMSSEELGTFVSAKAGVLGSGLCTMIVSLSHLLPAVGSVLKVEMD